MQEKIPKNSGILRHHVFLPKTHIAKRLVRHRVRRKCRQTFGSFLLYHLPKSARRGNNPRQGRRLPNIVIIERYRLKRTPVRFFSRKKMPRKTSKILRVNARINIKSGNQNFFMRDTSRVQYFFTGLFGRPSDIGPLPRHLTLNVFGVNRNQKTGKFVPVFFFHYFRNFKGALPRPLLNRQNDKHLVLRPVGQKQRLNGPPHHFNLFLVEGQNNQVPQILPFHVFKATHPICRHVVLYSLPVYVQMKRQIGGFNEPVNIKDNYKKSCPNGLLPGEQNHAKYRAPAQKTGQNFQKTIDNPVHSLKVGGPAYF